MRMVTNIIYNKSQGGIMPTKKVAKTSTKKPTVKKASAKDISIEFAAPGSIPEKRKVKAGTTIEQLLGTVDKAYSIRVNQETVDASYELQNDDVVRVGVNTKNN